MKLARKLVTLAIVLAMVMAFMIPTAMAETSTPSITINANNDGNVTESLIIKYTYYKILNADIGEDANVGIDGVTTTDGQVAYYITEKDQVDELNKTGLFNVVPVPGEDKWYVELTNEETKADAIVAAFSDSDFNLTKFEKGEVTKDSNVTSVTATVTAGYYYIVSDLGTKVAVQTLSPVTINEKNSYPTISKSYNATTDALAGINDEVSYEIKVTIPATVAGKDIVLVDTITNGLTLNPKVTVSDAVNYSSAVFVETTIAGVYKLTIPAATVQANAGKTLTFTYKATVNANAKVLQAESNKVHLVYGDYITKDTLPVETKTLAFTVQKVDGANLNTQLTGAEFSLWTAAEEGTKINLVKVSDGVYRVATAADNVTESAPVEAGVATIEGLNNATYYLQEDKAPTSYNKLDKREAITVSVDTASPDEDGKTTVDNKVANNKGVVLPSTGGIGTTIFYVLGGVLFLGALVILFTNKRMRQN